MSNENECNVTSRLSVSCLVRLQFHLSLFLSSHPELDQLPDEADVLDAVVDLPGRLLSQEVPDAPGGPLQTYTRGYVGFGSWTRCWNTSLTKIRRHKAQTETENLAEMEIPPRTPAPTVQYSTVQYTHTEARLHVPSAVG